MITSLAKRFIFLFFLSSGTIFSASAQLNLYTPEALDGYLLFEDRFFDAVYLVNNCGEIINNWEGVDARLHTKLLPNGNIIFIQSGTNRVIERDWDNNTVHQVQLISSSIRLTYEVIKLPNDNYLCVGREFMTESEFRAKGFFTDGIQSPSTGDVVVELDGQSGEVVWIWRIFDHVIQQRSADDPNYGILKDNPQLLNMDALSAYDWTWSESFMINGMDYNPTLDQIALSVRKMSEFVIIDHSTTIEEAADSIGGNMGKGGDILFRWGNPQNYDVGDAQSRYLYLQHNPNWIEYGPNEGKIICYNNGLSRPSNPFGQYSSSPIVNTPFDSLGNYIIDTTYHEEPQSPDLDYNLSNDGIEYYSQYTSAAKILPNGNTLLTIGDDGLVMELDTAGVLVWSYGTRSQNIFRSEKYPSDYPGFIGKDLTAGEVLWPSDVPCFLNTSVAALEELEVVIFYDSEVGEFIIEPDFQDKYRIHIYNMMGQTIFTGQHQEMLSLSLSTSFSAGTYLVQITNDQTRQSIGKKVVVVR